jgi:hypothetical protein
MDSSSCKNHFPLLTSGYHYCNKYWLYRNSISCYHPLRQKQLYLLPQNLVQPLNPQLLRLWEHKRQPELQSPQKQSPGHLPLRNHPL